MKSEIEKWIEKAQYDFDTAHAMMSSKRYLYVVFCCQQALEKLLKAHIVMQTQQFPPRIHNLVRLVEITSLQISDKQELFLRDISNLYLHSRYPGEIESLDYQIDEHFAFTILNQTEELFQWLLSMLQ